jgi:hypothetical protein
MSNSECQIGPTASYCVAVTPRSAHKSCSGHQSRPKKSSQLKQRPLSGSRRRLQQPHDRNSLFQILLLVLHEKNPPVDRWHRHLLDPSAHHQPHTLVARECFLVLLEQRLHLAVVAAVERVDRRLHLLHAPRPWQVCLSVHLAVCLSLWVQLSACLSGGLYLWARCGRKRRRRDRLANDKPEPRLPRQRRDAPAANDLRPAFSESGVKNNRTLEPRTLAPT